MNENKKIKISTYVLGFLMSVILTLLAYFLAVTKTSFDSFILIVIFMVLALIQLIVQLVFFLHMANESRPRWNLLFFMTTLGGILILIVGSIWIMYHLNYNMTPQQINNYVESQDGF
ncbi:MAG TPA: cytochrome o ubiquinol oxidase subunit IV [Patescibacteria group bacterium]